MRAKTEFLSLVLLATFACLAPPYAHAQPQQDPDAQDVLLAQRGHHPNSPAIGADSSTHNPITGNEKQRKSLLHANLAKSKKDAAELAALARQLREELDRPNVNSLSPESMIRLEKIERLAKKIREELKGY